MSWRTACAGAVLAAYALAPGARAQPLQNGLRALADGRTADAVQALETARQTDAARVEVYAPLAAAYLRAGDARAAERVADAGLHRFPGASTLQLLKAELLVQRDAYAEAAAIYEALVRRDAEGMPPERIEQRLRAVLRTLVVRSLDDGDPAGAARWARRALGREPHDPALHHAHAVARLRSGDPGGARAAAEAGLQLAPGDARLLAVQSAALLQSGDVEQALAPLEALHARSPDDVDAGLQLISALVAARNPARAAEIADTLLARRPRDTRLYDALAEINRRAFHTNGVVAVLRRRLAVFPDDADARAELGEAYESMRDWDAARGVYDTLATAHGTRARRAIARTYEAEGALRTAAEHYEALDAETDGDAAVLRALGRLYERLSAWASARDVAGRLLAATPTADAWARRARADAALGRPARALDAFRQALVLDPDDAGAHLGTARARLAVGDTSGALGAAERAVGLALDAAQAARQIATSGERLSIDRPDAPDDEPLSPAGRLARTDALADSAFAFWSTAFPPDQTTPRMDALVEAHPDLGRVRLWAGQHALRHGDAAGAEAHLAEAARLAPRVRAVHVAFGALHEHQGDLARALLAYERARALDESAPDAYAALLRVALADGTLDALLDRWLPRLRATPRNDVLRDAAVEALHRAGRHAEAARLAGGRAAATSSDGQRLRRTRRTGDALAQRPPLDGRGFRRAPGRLTVSRMGYLHEATGSPAPSLAGGG